MAKHAQEQWRRPRFGWIALIVVIVLACGAGGAYAASVFLTTAAAVDPTPTPRPTTVPTTTVSTPAPTPTATPLPAARPCAGRTTMSVMAHYDDDLLFANPEILKSIKAGDCVRTVFLTAGDAGQDKDYYGARETGLLRAYNVMRHKDGLQWSHRAITLKTGVQVTELVPEDSTDVSVVFFRLPDGGLKRAEDGSLYSPGSPNTGNASLQMLREGKVPTIRQLETGAPISLEVLQASVVELMQTYTPAQVLTLVPAESQFSSGDHPDHSAVGSITRDAATAAALAPASVRFAVGYESKFLPQNLHGDDLGAKVRAFEEYAKMDPVSFCNSLESCLALPTFGQSLTREYLKTWEEVTQ